MSQNLGTYEWVHTADGSPSLKALGQPTAEWMHSSGGAFAESVYIYGEAIHKALGWGKERFISVGLGLGYNELLVMAYALKEGADLSRIQIESFEADPQLVKSLLSWLGKEPSETQWSQVYDLILAKFSEEFGPKISSQLPELLLEKYTRREWLIHGCLTTDSRWTNPFHCILYDAFSSKSTPELWTEEFLSNFLKGAANEASVFATYACTGALKRSLVKAGFEVVIKKGFHVKKQSTLAYRI